MLNKKKAFTKKEKHNLRHKTPIKSGDTVYLITGKERGKTGKVLKVDRVRHRVVVEGLNLKTKYQKANKERGIPGKMFKIEGSIHISNVKFFDGKKPISLSRKDGKRINKKTKKEIKEVKNV